MVQKFARAALSFALIATALTVGANASGAASAHSEPVVDQPASSSPTEVPQSARPNVATTAGILDIAAGDSHTCILLDTGTVKCWGYNYDGQLGDGTNTNRSVPVDVVGLNNVVAIAAGWGHTCALQSNGGIRCWGRNVNGQLGDGTTTQRNMQARVLSLGGAATSIAAGSHHTCALLSSGLMRCWGQNSNYQLGAYSPNPSTSPITATFASGNVIEMALGEAHSCVRYDTGGLGCWGDGYYGQLGNGTLGNNYNAEVTPTGMLSGTARLLARGPSTCALMTSGALLCWGYNASGQVGNATNGTSPYFAQSIPAQVTGLSSGVTTASAGGYHTCGVQFGDLFCWGNPSAIGSGTYGSSYYSPMAVWGPASGVTRIAAGGNHSCALARGGVICWGSNWAGQLGNGSNGNQTTPVPVVGLEPAPEDPVACTSEGFESVPPPGWTVTNNSQPPGITDWFQGDTSYFPAAAGPLSSYAAASIDNTSGEGTISDWLISQPMSLTEGDRLAFWTRKVSPDNYPDRLEFRMSIAGESTDVGATVNSVGDFTSLLRTVDPNLTKNNYPQTWFPFTTTVHGITGTVTGRVAFRYYVTNGGPGGINSDYIGIDSFSHCVPNGPILTPTPTPTQTPTRTPTATRTATPTATQIPTATQTPTETLVPTATPTVTETPTQQPSQTPTTTPTATVTPTVDPNSTPANTPTVPPTSTPWGTSTPSPTPTLQATSTPSSTPSPIPSSTPTAVHTPTPTSLPTAAVGDRVWLDSSGNGKQDPGETGVSGVTVTLKMWNGVDDFVTLATTRTGGTGLYLFDSLQAADYLLVFDHPAGYAFAAKHAAGATDATDSDVEPTTGESDFFTLAAGDNRRTFDAGLVPLPTATPTATPTSIPTETATPTSTPTATPSVTPTETLSPTATPTTGPAYSAFIPMALREP